MLLLAYWCDSDALCLQAALTAQSEELQREGGGTAQQPSGGELQPGRGEAAHQPEGEEAQSRVEEAQGEEPRRGRGEAAQHPEGWQAKPGGRGGAALSHIPPSPPLLSA